MNVLTERVPLFGWLLALWASLPGGVFAAEPEKLSFDDQIAPLLARRCLSCHDGSAKEGGLDLTRAAGLKTGGDSGPAVTPGKPEESLLWARLRDDEMPPKQTLPAAEKQLLKRWISDGAHWGTDPIDPFRFSTESRAGYDWWSLQPLARPEAPAVKNGKWPRNEIDRFVLAKLEAAGLSPAEPAETRTLLRRLYFDLIGLPPLLSERNGKLREELLGIEIDLEAFGADPAAYAQVADRLLESPHYGERWGRRWLDVIRFGESQGYERNRIRDNAWRYRDWVVQSFNDDLPYDEFIRRQIAGDVSYPDDLDALLATGFLVSGTWDQVGHNEGPLEMRKAVRQDDLEDLVGAVSQSFLGLTANCARCHDHKFDPISQKEYYQLAAALGGVTQEEKERQGIAAKPTSPTRKQWAQQREAVRQELAELEQSVLSRYSQSEGRPLEGVQAVWRPGEPDGKTLTDHSGVGEPLNLTTGDKAPFVSLEPPARLVNAVMQSHELTVEVWLTPGKASQSGPARIVTLSQDTGQRNFTLGHDGTKFDLRLRTTKTDQNGLPSLSTPEGAAAERITYVVFTFDRKGEVRGYVDGKLVANRNFGGDLSNWNRGYRLALGNEQTGDRRWEGQLHFVALYNKALSPEQVARNFAPVRSLMELNERSRQLDRSERTFSFNGVAHVIIPKQPPVYHVLARGDYRNPGETVAPRGLGALSRGGLSADFGLAADAPEAQRRVALAKWLSDPRNPLTPRVMVNRLWHYHFGQGIVDTPSDFGFAGGRPTHPQLLDWLASRFIDGGWKLKELHRLIVGSATYQQSANVGNPAAQERDADNRLLWRANPRRLDGESIRDAMLAVSGTLNRQLGGPSYRDVKVKLDTNHEFTEPTGEFNAEVNRRTLYRLWARCGNNPLLESFDCPDPSVMSPRRSETITPAQALSLLNGKFSEQCADRLAERTRTVAGGAVEAQVDWLYRTLLLRAPQPRELELARGFVEKHGLEQFALVLFNANEFLFVE